MTTSSNLFSLLSVVIFFAFFGCSDSELDTPIDGNSITDTGLCLVEINGVFEDIDLDQEPLFIDNGQEGFVLAIHQELNYPAQARAEGVEGECIIEYEITESGTVDNLVVTQDPGAGIGVATEAALLIATTGVSFNPGLIERTAVKVKKQLLVNFKLQ